MKFLILIDHGSKAIEAHKDILWLQQQLQPQLDIPVLIAHMEIASPSLLEAITEASSKGATILDIFPLFLVQGKHLSKDIPSQIQEMQTLFPQIQIQLRSGLRQNPLLAKLILESILE